MHVCMYILTTSIARYRNQQWDFSVVGIFPTQRVCESRDGISLTRRRKCRHAYEHSIFIARYKSSQWGFSAAGIFPIRRVSDSRDGIFPTQRCKIQASLRALSAVLELTTSWDFPYLVSIAWCWNPHRDGALPTRRLNSQISPLDKQTLRGYTPNQTSQSQKTHSQANIQLKAKQSPDKGGKI